MLRRVRTFGFHLATLDVRQNAEVHRQIIGRALDAPDWLQRTRRRARAERLREALAKDESPPGMLEAAGKRALWVFEAMEYCSHRYGQAAIGSYVVSMANDVGRRAVGAAARALGGTHRHADSGQVGLDVAPLFESVETLEAAGEILARLLDDPIYRAHLAARGNRQVVMIGYADSNKESGIVASRWLLRKAQVAMQQACAAAGVELVIFHGRGGSVSRGGSRTEAIVRSLPTGVVARPAARHGAGRDDQRPLWPAADRAADVRAGPQHAGARRPPASLGPSTIDTALARGDGRAAPARHRAHYRTVVHDDPRFLEFFRLVTPVDVIERMQIGSRPLSRPVGTGVDAMRAVPWIFAWSQSRHMLPGWFGAGTACRHWPSDWARNSATTCIGSWPFFQGLVDDVEMRLARADMGIAGHYEELAGQRRRSAMPALIRARVRPHARARAAAQGLRAAARFGADAAALDLAAQSLRRSDPPDADRTAATLARGRIARSMARCCRRCCVGERHRAGSAGHRLSSRIAVSVVDSAVCVI